MSNQIGDPGGGTVILADTESLAQAAHRWFELLPKSEHFPEAEAEGLLWTDPASVALTSAVADWPIIFLEKYIQVYLAASAFVAAVDNTSGDFLASDQSGAGRISSSVGPTLV